MTTLIPKVDFKNGGSTPTGAINRAINLKLEEIVSVTDFGADNTGATDCSTAITNALAAFNEIYFPPGIYKISTNLTTAYAKVITLAGGASFSVDTGKTLKIQSQFNAPTNQKIFSGAGTVTGIRVVYPEWFGAVGDNTTDDQPALQKCITCIRDSAGSAGGQCYVYLSAKRYALARTWTIQLDVTYSIYVQGANTGLGGTALVALTGFDYTNGGVVNIEGASSSPGNIIDFSLRGFQITPNDTGVGIGLSFNTNQANSIQGLQMSIVEDINITGFQTGIQINRLRLVYFHRVSVWNSMASGLNVGAFITDALSGTGSGTCGDMSWNNCQFVSNAANTSSYSIYMVSKTGNGGLSGFRFTECIFYSAHTQIYLECDNNSGNIGDVWITNCQMDNCTGYGIDMLQLGASSSKWIGDIQIKGNYFTAVQANAIRMIAQKQGGINSTIIDCNYVAGCANAVVNTEKVNGLNVTNNFWSGCTNTATNAAAINISNNNQVNIIGNNFGQAGGSLGGSFYNMINLLGTGDYYVAQGNNSAGLTINLLVYNTTAATHTSITGNI